MTSAGSLAMANAEVLSGLAIAQLRRPGTPFLFGSGSGPLDMLTAVGTYGSLEIKWHIEDISSMKLTLNIDALEKGEKTPGKIESTIPNQDILIPLTISWCD